MHVWRATLDRSASSIRCLGQTLSPDERARAARFHFRGDRERFIVGRGLLRAILGRYLEAEPKDLRFCYSPHGKPDLAKGFGERRLRFNLAHSDALALYAITRGRGIGVDLERLRSDVVDEGIAERFFASGEVAVLRSLPPNVQPKAFFACWTRKEAYIKARGEGLSMPLDRFEVSLAPGDPAALLSADGDQEEVSRWSLRELAPGPGYAAALCVEGHGWRLKCREWPDE